MTTGMLQPNQPVKFQARNHRPFYKRLKSGDFYGGNIEYDQETWELLKTIPDNAIIEVILYYHDGDEAPQAASDAQQPASKEKPKPEKGPHSEFWQRLFKINKIQYDRDLWERLDVADHRQVKEKLREEFDVESLTFVSPTLFASWCEQSELHRLATIAHSGEAV